MREYPDYLYLLDLQDAWDGLSKNGGCVDYLPVKSKRDFAKRYEQGEFGNRPPTWNTFDDWLKEFPSLHMTPPDALYHLRNRVAGGPTFYNVPPANMVARYNQVLDLGVPSQNIYVSQMIPKRLERTLLIQGEVQQDHNGLNSLDLYYTTVPKPMRDALAEESKRVTGVVATMLLKLYMCDNSWQWLNTLLERYPGHVIEFSTYPTAWGVLPNYNTIFWEVRAY